MRLNLPLPSSTRLRVYLKKKNVISTGETFLQYKYKFELQSKSLLMVNRIPNIGLGQLTRTAAQRQRDNKTAVTLRMVNISHWFYTELQ